MADDGSPQSRNPWTRPRFPFRVQWDAEEMRFQEALGLDAEARSITHRAGGNSEVFSPFTMPGLKKAGNVTLKKGVVKANSTLQRPVGAHGAAAAGVHFHSIWAQYWTAYSRSIATGVPSNLSGVPLGITPRLLRARKYSASLEGRPSRTTMLPSAV